MLLSIGYHTLATAHEISLPPLSHLPPGEDLRDQIRAGSATVLYTSVKRRDHGLLLLHVLMDHCIVSELQVPTPHPMFCPIYIHYAASDLAHPTLCRALFTTQSKKGLRLRVRSHISTTLRHVDLGSMSILELRRECQHGLVLVPWHLLMQTYLGYIIP